MMNQSNISSATITFYFGISHATKAIFSVVDRGACRTHGIGAILY